MCCQKLLKILSHLSNIIYRIIESSIPMCGFDWICRCQLTSETKSCVDRRLVVENRGVGLAFRKSNEEFHDICCASETIQQTSIQQLSSNLPKKNFILGLERDVSKFILVRFGMVCCIFQALLGASFLGLLVCFGLGVAF